jgi:DNA-binding winged helix-turn-helix (wHTH) protein
VPRYAFGPFSLDTETRTLHREAEPIQIAGKTFDMLVVLVENHGHPMDKDELLSRVWSGTIVEEANLSQAIFTVRKILGDSAKDPRYIATIAGRGYQFVAPVTDITRKSPREPESDSVIIGSLTQRHKVVTAAAIAAGVAAVGALWFIPHHPAKAPAE